jgi:hypothetical protein
MVNARLNMICGNCGCIDEFTAKVDLSGVDMSDAVDKFEPSVSIYCNNCSTIHDLSDNLKDPKIIVEDSQNHKYPGLVDFMEMVTGQSVSYYHKEMLKLIENSEISKHPYMATTALRIGNAEVEKEQISEFRKIGEAAHQKVCIICDDINTSTIDKLLKKLLTEKDIILRSSIELEPINLTRFSEDSIQEHKPNMLHNDVHWYKRGKKKRK